LSRRGTVGKRTSAIASPTEVSLALVGDLVRVQQQVI